MQKVPIEIYLQEGIVCHFSCCGAENPSIRRGALAEKPVFLLMSAECLVEALPLIEENLLATLIVMRSALAELKMKQPYFYRRVLRFIDRKNVPVLEDRNSKPIWEFVSQLDGALPHAEKVAAWYRQHVGKYEFRSLCSSQERRQAGKQAGGLCSAGEYLEQLLGRNPFLAPTLLLEATTPHFPFLEKKEMRKKLAEGALERGALSVSHRDGGGRIQCGIEGQQTSIDIPYLQLNRAVDGDIVAVEVTETSFTSSTGKVVGIERRTRKVHACTLHQVLDEEHVLLKPVLLGLPYLIARSTIPAAELEKSLVLAWIEEWPELSRYPFGHLIRVIGKEGHIKAETEALLSEYAIIDQPFEEEAENELPDNHWTIPPEELEKRADFRSLPVASIDPEGCVDIDDALHARFLPSGLVEIGVHIADVTHFVREGSALDREGRIRGCSVYLPNRRIDMLPSLLGTNLCSLHQQRDRLAFSVIWEVKMPPTDSGDIEIVKRVCTKSVICSRQSFTYTQASEVLAGKPHGDEEIVSSLCLLKKVSSCLKKHRLRHGAFVLHSAERRITSAGSTFLNELSEEPGRFMIKEVELPEEYDTHTLVEEFMLLANHDMAEMITRAYPKDSLIRIHPAPSEESFKKLEHALCVLSPGGQTIRLDPKHPSELSSTLGSLGTEPTLKNTIGSWAAQCMTQAVYTPSSIGSKHHYGLAMDNYTHFTSPIRRYADMVVHRIAVSAMNREKTSPVTQSALEEICDSINRSYRRSKHISREANALHVRHLITNEVVTVCIISILPNRVMVHCPDYGVDGSLQIESSFRISSDSISYPEAAEPLSLLSSAKGVLCSAQKRELVFKLVR